MTTPKHRLCVYCGSGPGKNPAYMKAADALGRAMANAGIGLVYGGGGMGLMGQVAKGVLAGGGHVTGIIPEFLVQRERMLEGVSELVVTRSMHERKTAMFEQSTGLCGAPGRHGHARRTGRDLNLGPAWSTRQAHHRC